MWIFQLKTRFEYVNSNNTLSCLRKQRCEQVMMTSCKFVNALLHFVHTVDTNPLLSLVKLCKKIITAFIFTVRTFIYSVKEVIKFVKRSVAKGVYRLLYRRSSLYLITYLS